MERCFPVRTGFATYWSPDTPPPALQSISSLLGSTMGRRDELEQILSLMEKGRLKPVIDRVFPLEDLADAHRYLEEGKQVGKIIIDIGS